MPLLFDGDCGFCTDGMAAPRRRFAPRAASVPYQDADLGRLPYPVVVRHRGALGRMVRG